MFGNFLFLFSWTTKCLVTKREFKRGEEKIRDVNQIIVII